MRISDTELDVLWANVSDLPIEELNEELVARLAHAGRKIGDVEAASAEYLAAHPYEVKATLGQDPETGNPRNEFRWSKFTAAPLSLGLLTGDAAHSIRSVLDTLLYGMARISGRFDELTEDEKFGIAFPIPTQPRTSEYPPGCRKMPLHPRIVRQIVRFCQPTSANPKWDRIQLLADLDNWDKHRVITPMTPFFHLEGDARKLKFEHPYEEFVGGLVATAQLEESLDELTWEFGVTVDGPWPQVSTPADLLRQLLGWQEVNVLSPVAQFLSLRDQIVNDPGVREVWLRGYGLT
jgi:hypothetical protein